MATDAPVRLVSIVGVDVAGYSARTEHHSAVSAFYMRADAPDGTMTGTLLSMTWDDSGSD